MHKPSAVDIQNMKSQHGPLRVGIGGPVGAGMAHPGRVTWRVPSPREGKVSWSTCLRYRTCGAGFPTLTRADQVSDDSLSPELIDFAQRRHRCVGGIGHPSGSPASRVCRSSRDRKQADRSPSESGWAQPSAPLAETMFQAHVVLWEKRTSSQHWLWPSWTPFVIRSLPDAALRAPSDIELWIG